MTNRTALLDLIKKRAIIHKEVTLASGQKSSYYIDARSLFLHGESATLIGEALYDLTKDLPMAAIGGPAVGALPLTVAATMHYHKMGKDMEGFFIRKEAKAHGLQKTVEGVLPPGGKVVIVVEDRLDPVHRAYLGAHLAPTLHVLHLFERVHEVEELCSVLLRSPDVLFYC